MAVGGTLYHEAALIIQSRLRWQLRLLAGLVAAIACRDAAGPTPDPVGAVIVRLAQPGLAVGSSIEASDTVRDAGGKMLTGRTLTWSSSNTAVATVSQSGMVTGVGRGRAEITATSEGRSGSATIDVVVIKPRSLSLGAAHSCGISIDGDAYCWGSNHNGQVGTDSTQSTRGPSLVKGGLKFLALSTASSLTYGLTSDGRFYCWGGIPCDPSAPNSRWDEFAGPAVPLPRRVPTTRALEVLGSSLNGSSYSPACAVGAGNVAYCWGTNQNGEHGTGTSSQSPTLAPDAPVVGNHVFADIASMGHACAITTAGVAYCWGRAQLGGLGDGTGSESWVPKAVAGNHSFKGIGVGRNFSCGVTTAGAAYCWGSNVRGALGTLTGTCLGQSTPCSATPVPVSGGHIFESISVGRLATCGLTSAGDIYCWGGLSVNEADGTDFGTTPAPFRSSLARDPGGVMFRTVSVGSTHVCAITTGGDVYCRGANNVGQLGNGSSGPITPSPEPNLVIGGIKFRAP